MPAERNLQIRFSKPRLLGEHLLPAEVTAWLSVHKKLKPAIADLVAGRAARLRDPNKGNIYLFICLDLEAAGKEQEVAPRMIMRARLRFISSTPAAEKKVKRQKPALDDAALGALLFARDTQRLATGAAKKHPDLEEAALLDRIRSEIRAGKWKKDNCSDCPYRFLNEGRIKTIGAMLTDKRVKKPKDTCRKCPSRPLLAALGK